VWVGGGDYDYFYDYLDGVYIEHDLDDHVELVDDFGACAVEAEFVAEVLDAAGGEEEVGEEEVGEEEVGDLERHFGRDVGQEAFEAVWVAWCWWGAVGVESDVFVGVAGAGAVGGPEFLYR